MCVCGGGVTDRSSMPYRLWLHDQLILLPVVVLIDRTEFTALTAGVDAGPAEGA